MIYFFFLIPYHKTTVEGEKKCNLISSKLCLWELKSSCTLKCSSVKTVLDSIMFQCLGDFSPEKQPQVLLSLAFMPSLAMTSNTNRH